MKPKLLVLELWGLGDLVIATPFLRAAAKKFSVTLLANPFALEMRSRFWPEIEVIPFIAPWTAFRGKYQLWRWPWPQMLQLRRQLVARKFDCALSARWDPRDHLVLKLSGARQRFGFARLKSQRFLTQELERPNPSAHRREYWRVAGKALDLKLSDQEREKTPSPSLKTTILLHSGARLPVRVWPLENFLKIARRLRAKGFTVQIACDHDQFDWWQRQGEQPICPRSVTELFERLENIGVFIGNDSGPGHLAAFFNLPTFTLFGPQLPEWFAPVSPFAEFLEGKACPYKPCSDYCRYPKPFCIGDISADEIWPQIERFANQHLESKRVAT